MKNRAVADLLEEIADFLEMQDVEWKPRAYRKAARNIASLSEPIEDIHDRGDLESIDGVGEAIADKVAEYLETGAIAYHTELKEEVPVDVEALTAVEGLGPKRVKQLYQALGITTLDELESAAREGKIAEVEGFGEKSQANILDHIAMARRGQERMLHHDAVPLARDLERRLGDSGAFGDITVVGSYRRRLPTVGDLDVLATAPDPGPAMDAFTGMSDVSEVLSRGDTKSSIVLAGDLHVDLRIVDRDSWGAALQYFTGSKDHNVALRSRAQEQGYTLNEYGLFRSGEGGERVAGATEQEVYGALGLPYIEPELREGRGELAAAEQDDLPDLVERDDLRGDLQMHTEWSDGAATVREMAEAAQARGHDYIAITDHGPSIAVTDGLQDADEVRAQRTEIREADDALDITVLQGIETDITDDGIDISHEMADMVDLVVASIHRAPSDPTDAVITAFEEFPVAVWGHPLNRKLLERDPVPLDLDRVLQVAAEQGVAVEINSQPRRMDLPWEDVQAHRDAVDFVISTDAHRPASLDLLAVGAGQARKGWLEPADVLTSLPVDALRDRLRTP